MSDGAPDNLKTLNAYHSERFYREESAIVAGSADRELLRRLKDDWKEISLEIA